MTGVRGPAATGLGKQVRAAQARLVVPFEDNRHLNRLLGEYDGHLALLEERLGIEAQAHGNVVTLTGPAGAVRDGARGAGEALRPHPAGRGHRPRRRRRPAAPCQPTMPRAGDGLAADPHAPPRRHGALAQPERLHPGPGARRSRVRPRPCRHRQDLPRRRLRRAVPGARAWWSASCCRGRRWRRASGWASCPATCARRSIPTCARSTTRSTTCCRRPRWSATSTTGVIEIAPLAFMRGRTLAHAFVILDEAQNTTSMQMKMFLTRIGEGSKMAVTGDPSQIDLPAGPALGAGGGGGAARAACEGIEASASRPATWCAATSWRASSKPTTRPARIAPIAHERSRRQFAVPFAVAGRRAGRSPSLPNGCRVTIVEEDGDWSGVRPARGRRSTRLRRRWPRHPRLAAGARAARPASCSAATHWCAASTARYRGKDAAHQRAVVSLPAPARRVRGRSRAYLGDVVLAAETVRREAARARHRARAPSPAPRRARPAASAGLRPRHRCRGGRDGAAGDRDPGDASALPIPTPSPAADPDSSSNARAGSCVP